MTKTIKIGEIDIEFDSTSEQEANKLAEHLNNNCYFIPDFFNKYKKISLIAPKEDALYISSVEELKSLISQEVNGFMEYVLPQVYNEENELTFLQYLIMYKLDAIKKYDEKLASHPNLIAYTNSIFSILATQYYKEQNTKEKIVDFMFELPDAEKSKIFGWVNERRRFDLFNSLLNNQYQYITENEGEEAYDLFMGNNMDALLDIINNDALSGDVILEEEIDKSITNLPPLTKEELDKLCTEYLIEIDPTLKWLDIYKGAKKNGKITYLKYDKDLKWQCLENGEKAVIIAPLSGTLKDFISFIHEFTHYVPQKDLKDDEYFQNSIREYPSIFIEMHALQFLTKKGYNEEAINTIRKQRAYWTQENAYDISPVLNYMHQLRSIGPITLEGEIEKLRIATENINDKVPKEMQSLLSNLLNPTKENATAKIDYENILLICNPGIVIDEYPYIIGKYLANKTIERLSQEPSTISTFLQITENLINETPKSIMEKLNLSVTEVTKGDKPNQYTKKEQN